MKKGLLAAGLLSLSGGLLLADKATDDRLSNAAKAFDEIMSAPDKGIPGGVLNKAACVGSRAWHEKSRSLSRPGVGRGDRPTAGAAPDSHASWGCALGGR